VLTLGIAGSVNSPTRPYTDELPVWFFHDAAAALIEGGVVIAAIEEERLSRVKHTNLFPTAAVRECLRIAGCGLHCVDGVAYFYDEWHKDKHLFYQAVDRPRMEPRGSRQLITEILSAEFDDSFDSGKVHFVKHHDSHATSAIVQSGFDECLAVVMDGAGEAESVSVYHADAQGSRPLTTYPIDDSLGLLYATATKILGYPWFDDYKVMGLASYGDPGRYRAVFDAISELLPDGGYHLNYQKLQRTCFEAGLPLRRRDEKPAQDHMDFAAALQEAIERVAGHVIEHWARKTGLDRIVLAGGVAQNCTFNGKLLLGGTFTEVFVHPAPHDAGAAVGAALAVERQALGVRRHPRIRSVFWGRELGEPQGLATFLERWSALVSFAELDDPVSAAAGLLADGEVIGWVQGRSEFGPRALGNRSILADPRAPSTRDRVNLIVKGREGYRPFAPSVLAERTRDFFDYPQEAVLSDFMGFTVPVRPERRPDLGAITHVDGTARVHPVDQEANPLFYSLLKQFGERTGIPVLLNTSFNNSHEPIVDSVEDALVCLLTTQLDAMVIENYLVRRRNFSRGVLLEMWASLAPHVEVGARTRADGTTACYARRRVSDYEQQPISAVMYEPLRTATRRQRVRDMASTSPDFLEELFRLWCLRLVRLEPGGPARL
jgi:predicted NodU family carbamoyl transferase